MKGNERYKFPGIQQICHGETTCSIGNMVSNLVIAHGTVSDGCWTYGDHFFRYVNIE